MMVDVNIEDSNDNRPVFSAATYEGAVAENSRAGTKINISSAILATDIDSDVYGTITYSIEAQDV